MPKLEVLDNKKLVLKNILKREVKNVSMADLETEILKVNNLLSALKSQTYGPLVIKTSGTNISDLGELATDYELMIQAYDYKQYKNSFEVIDRFEVPGCAYVRFKGNPEDLHYAYSKLDLYFYENELESTNEVYSIALEETEYYTVVDLFRPILIFERN